MIPSNESGYAPQDEWGEPSDETNQLGTDYFFPQPVNEFPDENRPRPGYKKPMVITLPDGTSVSLSTEGRHRHLIKPRFDHEDEQEPAPEDHPSAQPETDASESTEMDMPPGAPPPAA